MKTQEKKEWWLYGLVNPRTGSIRYCGQSCRPKQRANVHRRKYPLLEMRQIGVCNTLEEVLVWEWLMVEMLGCPLNEMPGGGSPPGMDGRKHSMEAKTKMSVAKSGKNHPNYGKTHSAETKAKMSVSKIGKKHPMHGKAHKAKTKAKISMALKDRALSAEHRTRLSAAMRGIGNHMYGKKHTAETRAKMSASRSGKSHYNYGKTLSTETRAKISAAKKNMSVEAKENIRVAALKREAAKRDMVAV